MFNKPKSSNYSLIIYSVNASVQCFQSLAYCKTFYIYSAYTHTKNMMGKYFPLIRNRNSRSLSKCYTSFLFDQLNMTFISIRFLIIKEKSSRWQHYTTWQIFLKAQQHETSLHILWLIFKNKSMVPAGMIIIVICDRTVLFILR